MTKEQHKKLHELRRILFTSWVNDPTNQEKKKQLDLIEKVLFG